VTENKLAGAIGLHCENLRPFV